MKCAGIIAKHTDPRAEPIVSELCRWLEEHGKGIVLDRETAALVGRPDSVVRSKMTWTGNPIRIASGVTPRICAFMRTPSSRSTMATM